MSRMVNTVMNSGFRCGFGLMILSRFFRETENRKTAERPIKYFGIRRLQLTMHVRLDLI